MTFEVQLRNKVQDVETTLENIMDTARLVSAGVPAKLAAAMRHAVIGSGKRVRPFLVIASADLFGVTPASAASIAAAVELVHCYSLVHDDLPAMDNDTLRRGQPSVWAAFDEHTAILAGDALLTMAFERLADPGLEVAPETRLQLFQGLARAAGPAGMVGGQQLDLDWSKGHAAPGATLALVEHMQSLKTGELLAFSAEAGAILAGGELESRRALRSYGRAIGLAFQIADDLLDLEGNPALVGKAVGKDKDANKATLIALMGPEEARRRLNALRDAAIAALAIFGPRADILREAAAFIASRKS